MNQDRSSDDLQQRLLRAAEVADDEWGRAETSPLARTRAQPSDPSQVYSVRVPVHELERLRSLAEARGLKPTVLMREWVLERLAAEDLAMTSPEERLLRLLGEARELAESIRSRIARAAADSPVAEVEAPSLQRSVRLGSTRRLATPFDSPDLGDASGEPSRQRRNGSPPRRGGRP